MAEEIEKFLDLNEEEIDTRKAELRRKLRTYPGTSYLKARQKQFEVVPWPFISYLAYYCPKLLEEGLSCYSDYDGSENEEAIMEQLREMYIFSLLEEDVQKKFEEDKIKKQNDNRIR
jgi:hypothetical protein